MKPILFMLIETYTHFLLKLFRKIKTYTFNRDWIFKSTVLWKGPKPGIRLWGVILSLVAKSKLPILVYILPYEVWLWGQNHGFSGVICISGLNKLILSTYTRFCLALRVWVMKMKPIVVHYGIGHRLLRSKGIFEIREFFMPKSSKIQPNFMNF